ncbi:MAG: hypothetical protein Q7S18_00915 [bacterium]|nr:hypothetical protein [bacterium]
MRIFKRTIYIGLVIFIMLLISGSFFCFFASKANVAVYMKMMAKSAASSFAMQHNSSNGSLPQCCIDQRNNEKSGISGNFYFQDELAIVNTIGIRIDPFPNKDSGVKIFLSDASPPEKNFLASVVKIE